MMVSSDLGQVEMETEPYSALRPYGDVIVPLYVLVDQLRNNDILVTRHQREPDAWPWEKQKRWCQRLMKMKLGQHPSGSYATYQLTAGGPVYLNDGLQRLSTTQRLADEPGLFGLSTESVKMILQQPACHQHRWFDSHEDAMVEFQLLNYGTKLTPYELCHGFITYMPKHDTHWKGYLDRLHKAIDAGWHRIQSTAKISREDRQKHLRHNLSLLYRFITEEKAKTPYTDVYAKELKYEKATSGVVIEQRLVHVLNSLSIDESEKQLRIFCGIVDQETSLLEQLRNIKVGTTAGFSPTFYRWCLDCAVWRRFNSIPVVDWEDFLSRLLVATRGKSQIIVPGKKTITLQLTNLGVLPSVCERIDSSMPLGQVKRSRVRDTLTRPGYDKSHVQPFHTNGNGKTIDEPASINRARGARPIV